MRKTKKIFVLRKASDPKGILPDWIAYSQSQPCNNSANFLLFLVFNI